MRFRSFIFSFLLLLMPAGIMQADARTPGARGQKVERSIAAEPTVAVSVCIDSGDVTVRGWDRNEVLARSSEVGRIELKRPMSANQTGAATKVLVLLADKNEELAKGGCHAFGNVEMMVPRGASVYLHTGDGTIDTGDVASVFARSETGSISIRKASRSVEAVSFTGEISVENSTGRMLVKSVSGVINVNNVRPNDENDCLEVATLSGDIQLDQVDHQQVTVKSANGKIDLSGALAKQGRYTFNTTSSDVTLSLPSNASFRLNARLSKNREIASDFPLNITIEDPMLVVPKKMIPAPAAGVSKKAPPAPASPASPAAPPSPVVVVADPHGNVDPKIKVMNVDPVALKYVYSLRRINAVHGSGDALITVSSFSGTIHLEDSGK